MVIIAVLLGLVAVLAAGSAAVVVSKKTEADRELQSLRQFKEAQETTLLKLKDENRIQGQQLQELVLKRPKLERVQYRIVTIGVPKTGKTTLTLKWACPIWDKERVQGTEFEKYYKTISTVMTDGGKQVTTYDFEILDYGGERVVKAQNLLVSEEVEGLLLVVDLGPNDATEVDEGRVKHQLEEFSRNVLAYFFDSHMVTDTCRTVVLFINKSDLIADTPANAETRAIELYSELIDNLRSFDTIDLTIMVGSASSGHNTHELFAHFIRHILPNSAYDERLVKGMANADSAL